MTSPAPLFKALAVALVNSGLREAYLVASNGFQDAGPFEFGQVLRTYEAAMQHRSAIESLAMEYQRTSNGSLVAFADGAAFHEDINGVIVTFEVSDIGNSTFRILARRVDAANLMTTQAQQIAKLKADLERLREQVMAVVAKQ